MWSSFFAIMIENILIRFKHEHFLHDHKFTRIE